MRHVKIKKKKIISSHVTELIVLQRGRRINFGWKHQDASIFSHVIPSIVRNDLQRCVYANRCP